MRLLLDQNLPLALAPILRDAGHNVVHTRQIGLERAPDEQILEHCCDDRRMLVTADKRLTKFLVTSQADCPSVLVTRDIRTMPAQDLGRLIEANLAAIAGVVEERGNAVFTMTRSKPIRASLLPLGFPGKE